MLYLERPEEALARYEEALGYSPEPHQAESTYQQAITAVQELDRRDIAEQIGELFREAV